MFNDRNLITKILHISISLLLILYSVSGNVVKAEELVISDNGAGSSNEVTTSVDSTTSVDQSNQSNVQNDVDSNSSTGENTASANTGDSVDIATGDTNTQLDIDNSVNSSVVDVECCAQGTSVDVSNNGSDSQNKVNLDSSNETSVSVNQTAYVSNNISGYANTGDNSANSNNGDVSIATGDIEVSGGITNGPINSSSIKAPQGADGASINVSGNGDNSRNYVLLSLNNYTQVENDFRANLLNNLAWNLNTGRNHANYNNGDVSITTGDILFDFFIKNGPINIGGVDISCCEYDPGESDEEQPTGGGEEQPGNGSESGNGDGSSSGDILAEAASTGGVQILGLSDTSSEAARTLLFWFGFVFIAIGLSILGKEFDKGKVAFFIKRITLR